MSDSFDNIFKAISKAAQQDKYASIHKAGDINIKSNIPYGVLTGLPELDLNIGRPGYPAGRCTEVFGFEHCGKTTLAYHAIANAQRMGGSGFFIDTEKSFDELRASQCGVDTDTRFGIIDADTIDATFRMINVALNGRIDDDDGRPFVIVVDSVTGSPSEAALKKEIGEEARVGQDARTIRDGMRRIMAKVAETNTILFMVNHAISTIPKFRFAKQSEAAGGHAIKLFASVRVLAANAGWLTEGEEKQRIGQKINLRVEKLKGSSMFFPDLKEIPLLNTIGFDTESNLLEAACKSGWVEHKKGSKSYTMGDLEFPKVDWPAVVQDLGGVHEAYKEFIKWCRDNEHIRSW